MKAMRMTILGPSGGGKGTQAKLIEEKYGWKHISVGEEFRRQISKETELGLKAKEYVESGKWVPTDLTFAVIKPTLEENLSTGFVLDGFPRLPDQPEFLDIFLNGHDVKLDLAIHIDIHPEVIMSRRVKAWEKGKSFYDKKRKDETIEAINSRIEEYKKTIEPIIKYYQEKNILLRVDGERPIEPIFKDISSEIEKRL